MKLTVLVPKENVYLDKDGNILEPIYCEDCGTIIGFVNESDLDELTIPIWCEDCGEVFLKAKRSKKKSKRVGVKKE